MKKKIEDDFVFILLGLFATILLCGVIFSIIYNKRKDNEYWEDRDNELREQAFVYEHSDEYQSFDSCIRIFDRYYCKND